MSKAVVYTCDGCKKKMSSAEADAKLVVREYVVDQSWPDGAESGVLGLVESRRAVIYHFCNWLCVGKRCKREIH